MNRARELGHALRESQKAFRRVEELATWGRDTTRALHAYNKAAELYSNLKKIRG